MWQFQTINLSFRLLSDKEIYFWNYVMRTPIPEVDYLSVQPKKTCTLVNIWSNTNQCGVFLSCGKEAVVSAIFINTHYETEYTTIFLHLRGIHRTNRIIHFYTTLSFP